MSTQSGAPEPVPAPNAGECAPHKAGAPLPPAAYAQYATAKPAARASASERRRRRARRQAAAPLFFGKQVGIFVMLAFATLIVNFALYTCVAVYESTAAFSGYTPASLTRMVGESISPVNSANAPETEEGPAAEPAPDTASPDAEQAESSTHPAATVNAIPTDTFAISEQSQSYLDDAQAWCMLIDEGGNVIWQRNMPEGLATHYSNGEIAAFARTGYLSDYTCFMWNSNEGLIVIGMPRNAYYPVSLHFKESTFLRLPFYAIGLFLINAGIFFCAYVVSKRRVLKSIEPVLDALDDLSCGKPTHVHASGSLHDIGESINATSAAMLRKDEARKRWVNGVSHDIRTPLAISMGTAERLAHDPAMPQEARDAAGVIVRQNERMRDFVSDLNIASRLEYDMQPLDVAPVCPAALVRQVAVDRLNAGLDERYSVEVEIAPEAEQARLAADERLLARAVRNLLENAIRHNAEGCRIVLAARCAPHDMLEFSVSDNGAGIGKEALARLNAEASAMQAQGPEEVELEPGLPVPPPFYELYVQKPCEAQDGEAPLPATAPAAPQQAAINAAFEQDEPLPSHGKPCAPDAPVFCASAHAEPACRPDTCKAGPSLAPRDLTGFNDHGLGLSLVTRIALAHGGSVSFEGAPGEGFSVTMHLPLARV